MEKLRRIWLLIGALFACGSAAAITNSPAGSLQAYTVELSQGADLLYELRRATAQRTVSSGFILSASGTLNQVALLLPEHAGVTTLTGMWSIVSLTGAIVGTNAQVNIVVGDSGGKTVGGQLANGSKAIKAQVLVGDFSAEPSSVASAVAAQPASAAVFSPEVSASRRVTFRLRAPDAREVSVTGDWGGEPKVLVKDATGVWSGSVGPLAPSIYSYTFTVDGLRMLDPANQWVKPGRSPRSSIVDVRGDALQVHHFQDVPHGVLRLHTYDSKTLKRERNLVVYTPPDYDKNALSRFPTLYLLHGNGDADRTWSVLGRANLILDNLIAAGKAKPMLVVMPDGHSLPPEGAGADYRQRNREAFRTELLQEIIPFVESNYRTLQTNQGRAIAGLSMGGGQSLIIGLNESTRFSWIGGFSSSLPDLDEALSGVLSDGKAVSDRIKLLWFACGKDDFLIEHSRRFDQLLTQRSIKHAYIETEGAHTWPLWRNYLADFVPLLFNSQVEGAASTTTTASRSN